MKRTARQYVKPTDNEKITEKVLYIRIGISVALIVFCLIAMAFAAYAYFVSGISSENNYIKAAEYDVDISILKETVSSPVALVSEDETEQSTTSTISYVSVPVSKNGSLYSANLKAGRNLITIDKNGSADTGFCIIAFNDCETTYFTQQIGVDLNTVTRYTNLITFDIILPADTTIYIFPHWGTSSYYGWESDTTDNYIASGDDINVVLTSTVEEISEKDTSTEDAPAEDTPAEDTPVEDTPAEETPAEDTTVEDTPAEDTPAEDTPAEDTPAEDTPAEDTPEEETPAEETPAEDTPVEDTPAEDTPVEDTPAEETPVEETPAEETPAEETPAEETPVEDTPAEETPAEETPAEETPAEETPAEDTTQNTSTEITE